MIAPISGRQRQRNASIHKKSVVHRGDGCHDLSKYKSFEIKAYYDFFNRLRESQAPADGPKRIEKGQNLRLAQYMNCTITIGKPTWPVRPGAVYQN
jgi:hypothetical protein